MEVIGGLRLEVANAEVVIAGNPANPLTRALVLDLERRLFIPHVIARTSQEEELVKREGKRDIVPLHLDVTDVGCANDHDALGTR